MHELLDAWRNQATMVQHTHLLGRPDGLAQLAHRERINDQMKEDLFVNSCGNLFHWREPAPEDMSTANGSQESRSNVLMTV